MRELTSHKVSGVNDGLTIMVCDEPGSGGANHHYEIQVREGPEEGFCRWRLILPFQNGPIREVGTNGVTHESLLAILIDRLEGFQRGKFRCDANAFALEALNRAQEHLLDRTRERAARGMEGTMQV